MTASLGNFQNGSYGSNLDAFVYPQFITAQRAPTANDIFNPGTRWLDNSVTPHLIYETTGAGDWDTGGVQPATPTTYGTVTLSPYATWTTGAAAVYPAAVVANANDVYTFVAAAIPGGGVPASTLVQGLVYLATNAQAVAGTSVNPNTALVPSNLASVFAAPPATGGTTPAAAIFTTLEATGLLTGDASATIDTAGTALNLATDSDTAAVNLGTVGARAITIGNVTTTTGVTVNTGTGHFTVNTTSTGDIILNSADTVLIDGAGVVEINSSAGVIGIGNDAVAQNINIGTGAAQRVITIGNVTNATSVVINSGTGAINIGTSVAKTITIGNVTGATGVAINVGTSGFAVDGVTNSPYTIGPSTTTGTITIGGTAQSTGVITLGSSSATSTVKIQSGAGASTTTIGEGTAGANTTSINNGATAASSTVNILSGAATAGTHAVNIFTGNASGGTQTFNLATGTNAVAVNIGTGTTGVKTIAIGGTAANVITIGNTQTTGSVAIGNALTSGTVTVGGTAGTGTITIGQATNATGQTVSINSGASIAGTNIVSVLAGATPAASQTFNLMTGIGTAGTYAVNILTGASTGTTQTVSIATGAAATTTTIGNITSTSGTILHVGTGNFLLDGAVTSTYTIGTALGTGLINIGLSTAGQTVALNNAASNTVANIVNILNGATPGADNTLNIMNGAGTAGTQTVNILATGATRAGAVNIGTGAAVHVITIGQVTSLLHVNGPQTNTLASGAATGLTVVTSAGTGRCLDLTSSGVTVPDILSNVGGIKVTPTDVAAGASPQTADNRHFKVVFNTVSIAASADQALVIQNSTITGVNTDIMFTWFGTTTGSAVSLKSVVNAAGQSTLTFTNGAGATTTTSNITVIGWVMN